MTETPSPGFDFTGLRLAYAELYPTYERLAETVANQLRASLRGRRLVADVQPRAKDMHSFLKKVMREPGKYQDPLAEITDKAGVRVVVALLADVAVVDQVVVDTFNVVEPRQDMLDRYDPDRLGYLGVHYLVSPTGASLAAGDEDLEALVCEVQIHTKAQSAWATINHPLTYKPVVGGVPPAVRRRIMRAVALVSLFDDEVDAARSSLMSEPGYEQAALLQELERHYIELAPTPEYDARLSMTILDVVMVAYGDEELRRFAVLIEEFLAKRAANLSILYASAAGDDEEVGFLLRQPEVIAIFERLEAAKAKLRAAWSTRLDPHILESLAAALGRPY